MTSVLLSAGELSVICFSADAFTFSPDEVRLFKMQKLGSCYFLIAECVYLPFLCLGHIDGLKLRISLFKHYNLLLSIAADINTASISA